MNVAIPDLWPADFGETRVIPPIAVLKQQAELLVNRTKNLLKCYVKSETRPSGGLGGGGPRRFHMTLSVSSPLLAGSEADRLFEVSHDVKSPYPCHVRKLTIGGNPQDIFVTNYDELLQAVQTILADESVVLTIRNLLAQAKNN